MLRMTHQHYVCCVLQDRKNRELGAENGKLQREVAKLTEHERQLEQVGVGGQSCALCVARSLLYSGVAVCVLGERMAVVPW